MDDRDWQITEQLAQALDAPSLRALCAQIADLLGFEHFFYAVRVPLSLTEPYHFSLSGYPPAWRQRYDALGYVKIDPIVFHAVRSMRPLCWDAIERPAGSGVAAFFADAAAHGLAHGISAPISGRQGDIAVMSLARGESQALPTDPSERHRLSTRLHWFATTLHESVRRVILKQDGAPQIEAPLTEREKDCLMWAADGKTSAEIARLLAITERTVLFHIESAGRKLGVSGRHNILSRAVALGEIDLHQHALRSLSPFSVMRE